METDQKSFDGEVSKIMIPSNESDFFFFFVEKISVWMPTFL